MDGGAHVDVSPACDWLADADSEIHSAVLADA